MSEGNGDQTQSQQRPWASPRQQPVKGVVQPRVLPPFGKPTRHTNKLDYIMTHVLKEAGKHKHVWPFQKPVDALSLCIPLYHEKIHRPMDLKTIEMRLKNTYYTCAQECIDDIETVFNNCYTFNGKEDDVTIMAQNVHEVIKKSLEQAPREEHDMDVYWGNKKKKGKVEGGKATSSERKKDTRGPSEAPSESGSEVNAVVKPERKVAGKKTGKRKADSDDEDKASTHRAKREVTTTKKDVSHPIPAALKPCLKMLNEFHSKKCAEMGWPFFEPVDAKNLGLTDYHKIVLKPMDLRTIKEKLESGEYKEPSEFEDDIRLMLNNCFLYNPAGDPVHLLGQRFLEYFERRWSELLKDSNSRASSVVPMSARAITPPVVLPKIVKTAKEPKKEPKKEVVETGAKSEDFMQINNALDMIRVREDKLKAELAAAASIKEKLLNLKSRRQDHPNEPFSTKLITEARLMCSSQIGQTSGGSGYKSELQNGKGKKTIKNNGYDFDSDDEENKVALTYSEKRNLSFLINSLPPEKLSTIIAIIQRREHSALEKQQQGDSEVELDFEALGDMCLREMSAFIKSLGPLVKNEPTASGRLKSGDRENSNSRPKSDSKSDKKKSLDDSKFNMSESSDDESSNRKRRKKESSESESSSSSDEDSDDEAPSRKKDIPRKSGQPPSTSHEWNHSAPPPRMGGMGGQPPMARVPPPAAIGKNPSGSNANSYQTPKVVPPPVPASTSVAAAAPTKPTKVAEKSVTLGASTSSRSNEKPAKKSTASSLTVLDTLLPDSFGSSQAAPSTSSSHITTSPKENGQLENGENEEARIQRMRMEAKRARQQEDENTMSMSNQMEMMSAFELDNIY